MSGSICNSFNSFKLQNPPFHCLRETEISHRSQDQGWNQASEMDSYLYLTCVFLWTLDLWLPLSTGQLLLLEFISLAEDVCVLSRFSHVRPFATPGSFVHGISQARVLEWVVMPSYRGSSWQSWLYMSLFYSFSLKKRSYHYHLPLLCAHPHPNYN